MRLLYAGNAAGVNYPHTFLFSCFPLLDLLTCTGLPRAWVELLVFFICFYFFIMI